MSKFPQNQKKFPPKIATQSTAEFKHGASLQVESEVFSMSIKHPKERRMDAFDWFIGDGPILARCRVPASLIRRVQWREFYSEN